MNIWVKDASFLYFFNKLGLIDRLLTLAISSDNYEHWLTDIMLITYFYPL